VSINCTHLVMDKLSTFAHPIEVVAAVGVGKYITIALRRSPATGRDASACPRPANAPPSIPCGQRRGGEADRGEAIKPATDSGDALGSYSPASRSRPSRGSSAFRARGRAGKRAPGTRILVAELLNSQRERLSALFDQTLDVIKDAFRAREIVVRGVIVDEAGKLVIRLISSHR
jgi:hypothetical protein